MPRHFPFVAIVGQSEPRLALTLLAIDPMIGGVLITGPLGTAKSTCARSFVDLVPGPGNMNFHPGRLVHRRADNRVAAIVEAVRYAQHVTLIGDVLDAARVEIRPLGPPAHQIIDEQQATLGRQHRCPKSTALSDVGRGAGREAGGDLLVGTSPVGEVGLDGDAGFLRELVQ